MTSRRRLVLVAALVGGCATSPPAPPAGPYEAAFSQYWDGHIEASRAISAMTTIAEQGDARARYWFQRAADHGEDGTLSYLPHHDSTVVY